MHDVDADDDEAEQDERTLLQRKAALLRAQLAEVEHRLVDTRCGTHVLSFVFVRSSCSFSRRF